MNAISAKINPMANSQKVTNTIQISVYHGHFMNYWQVQVTSRLKQAQFYHEKCPKKTFLFEFIKNDPEMNIFFRNCEWKIVRAYSSFELILTTMEVLGYKLSYIQKVLFQFFSFILVASSCSWLLKVQRFEESNSTQIVLVENGQLFCSTLFYSEIDIGVWRAPSGPGRAPVWWSPGTFPGGRQGPQFWEGPDISRT